MKYIKEQNVDSYYEDIYNQEIKGYINLEENQNDTVKDAINDVIDVLTVSEKIINFLNSILRKNCGNGLYPLIIWIPIFICGNP